MSNFKEEFRARAEKLELKESRYPNRFHNGKVAIELDRRNDRQIIVSWEVNSGFESKRFRCTDSLESWLERAFEFAARKAQESAQESLELTNRTVRHRIRRGAV